MTALYLLLQLLLLFQPRHQMMRAAQLLLMAPRCGPPQLSMEAVWAQKVEALQSTLLQESTVVGEKQ